ncbi:family 16 glycoside hydrolase [Calycomorphotria hydatis]|uniref:Soluble aldose sugar dehydrogenase YliI n=1 Tax=Calycomorphotria hydatis TaxID=2528027 RepID=A0A517TDU4_9PLAN|nr:family 16 glycoside hydrolase [Calycomorphotria hydatis]QDT66532.1 Soluble aldose sugar dehydrogenase YliI precursor [Calycomorphotria hydatis]
MKNFCTSIVLTLCALNFLSVATAEEQNKLTEVERLSGWKLLFDGESIDQWRTYKSDKVEPGWEIVDGELRNLEGAKGDLITRKKYDAFELSLEYKVGHKGNSGVMFHVQETLPSTHNTGPEVQILDNPEYLDYPNPQLTGYLYQLYQPKKPAWALRAEKEAGLDPVETLDATRPAGEWNHLHIKVHPDQSVVLVNGVRYYTFKKGSDDWNKRVSESKHHKHPEFGVADTGYIALQNHGGGVAFRNIKLRDLSTPPKDPEHGELAVGVELAFPELEWADWEGVDENGKVMQQRPIIITDSPKDDGLLYVGMQRGQIHVLDERPDVKESRIFLDISERVASFDEKKRGNEEGLLGFALHPNFPEDPRCFVYYTLADDEKKSIVSSFGLSSSDPTKADPESEQVLLTIDQPFNNHNGGSIVFGQDGYLYIGMGDGGSANDPLSNGQDLSTLLGKVLRIDVDSRGQGKGYGIPADNPFVDQEGALPEIYASGFRNVWRLNVDSKNGAIWVADVGQDLYEEINILKKGGNYGWSDRESMHSFGKDGKPAAPKYIEPVWEYDHTTGKSITGGAVYRGTNVPELVGKYLYADFVSGKLWALDYDYGSETVRSNMRIPTESLTVMTFGEGESGEVYFSIPTASGRSIYKFVSADAE